MKKTELCGSRHDVNSCWLAFLNFCVGMFIAVSMLSVSHAQLSTAGIVGTVVDKSGAAVPDAGMTVTNLATGLDYKTATDLNGNYGFTLLPPGRYRVHCEKTGFKSWSIAEVALSIGDRFRADATLEIGALQDSITVQADSPALQTESATVGSLISQHGVQNLPVNGRNFVTLAQLAPGASDYSGGSAFSTGNAVDDRRRPTVVSVNGATASENNFLIDGMDNNERFIGTVVVKPSMDAIGEMKVVTNTFSADLGRTIGGAIIFTTKSGSNEFHGTAYEFFRNQQLDARPPNLALGARKPPYKQNNFGGSVGGPVRKNRSFFFFDWETYMANLGTVLQSTVPTIAEKARYDFTGVNPIWDVNSTIPDPNRPGGYVRTPFPNATIPAALVNPVSKNILALYPDPQNSSLTNNYAQAPARKQTDNTMDIRLDHRFSDNNNAFVRYSRNKTFTDTPHALPTAPNGIDPVGGGTPGTSDQIAHNLQVNDAWVLSPKLLLNLKASYSRFALRSVQVGYGRAEATLLGLPGINVDEDSSGVPTVTMAGYTGIGEGGFLPTLNTNNTFQYSASIQYTRGAHSLKIGGDLARRLVAVAQSNNAQGTFNFGTNFTNDPSSSVATNGNGLATMLLGFPTATSRTKFLIHPGYTYTEWDGYIQDDWHVNRWLTLNPGLRWDYYSPLVEDHDRITTLDFSTLKLIYAGQNGASRSLNVQKDRNNFAPRFGFAARADRKTVIRGGIGITYQPLFQGSPGSFRNAPYQHNYSVAPGQFLPINKISDGLPLPVGNDPVNLSGAIAVVRPDFVTPYVIQYNMAFQRQLPRDLVFTSSYVSQLGRKLSPANGSIEANGIAPGPELPQARRVYAAALPNVTGIGVVRNWYNNSYQSMQNTLEHRFKDGVSLTVNHTWSHNIDAAEVRYLSYGQIGQIRGSANSDIRHRVTIAATWNSPFGKKSNAFYNLAIRNWNLNTIGVIRTGSPLAITQNSTRVNSATGTDRPNVIGDPNQVDRTWSKWFNTAAFAAQPLYTWGNEGRNVINGPGTWNFDVGLAREFHVMERYALQFRLETFNTTNTVHPTNPNTTLGSVDFGKITSVTGNRQCQVALKIIF
ncbi:MAG: TonB-dependent receptor [Candidatus Solibacter sp.]